MSIRYFSNFPIITYSLNSSTTGVTDLRTNIFRRVAFRDNIITNAKLFYPYTIKDGDLPEIIADKLYGSVDYYWVVTLFNKITDPVLDWPKSYGAFQSFIVSKYGSIATAKNQIHHYTKTVTKVNNFGERSEHTYIIDSETYNSLTSVVPVVYTFPDQSTVTITTSRDVVYTYDYEDALNESKRKINLLKKEYLDQARAELAKLSA